MDNSIFVQIASYRDPQLIPTLIDLIERAARPQALRVVVCWQHHHDETIDAFLQRGFKQRNVLHWNHDTVWQLSYGAATVELIDIPYMRGRGACWARNLIQQRFEGEKYTLQLDSHCRFIDGWDTELIDMLEALRKDSPKPLVTAYPPAFDPDNDPAGRENTPTYTVAYFFNWQGVLILIGTPLENAQRPVRGRFYSAGFAFADGSFATEVQHDPHFFFYGEEISISARAFTHGYDVYHPHRVVAWHYYNRQGRKASWDDLTESAKQKGETPFSWWELDLRSFRRNRQLFGMDGASTDTTAFGSYGFGTVRTLADFERFAGLCFAKRGISEAALHGRPPVVTAGEAADEGEQHNDMRRSNDIVVWVPRSSLEALSAAGSARLTAFDSNETPIQHCVLERAAVESALQEGWFNYHWQFLTPLDCQPVQYTFELLNADGKPLFNVRNAVSVAA